MEIIRIFLKMMTYYYEKLQLIALQYLPHFATSDAENI